MTIRAEKEFTTSVPHDGLNKNSARGFALEQFARQLGFQSFAEFTVDCFDKTLQISGQVFESDAIQRRGTSLTTFGYEVVLRVEPTPKREP